MSELEMKSSDEKEREFIKIRRKEHKETVKGINQRMGQEMNGVCVQRRDEKKGKERTGLKC